VALDGVRWGPGALGEVTNTTMTTNPNANGSSAMLPKEVLGLGGCMRVRFVLIFLSFFLREFKVFFCRCDVDLGRGDERSGAVDQ
jgi:hypothetical protein